MDEMSTLKVFWFFLWRMGLLGPVLGAVLGAAYGILLGLAISLSGIFMVLTSRGIEQATSGNILGLFILPAWYGTFLGAIVGTPVGLILGGLGGLLLGILTRVFHYPTPANPRRYYAIAGVVCVIASVLVHFIVGSLVFDVEDLRTFLSSLVNPERGSTVGSVVFVMGPVVVFVILPALIATSAMSLTGALVSVWYVKTSGARVDG